MRKPRRREGERLSWERLGGWERTYLKHSAFPLTFAPLSEWTRMADGREVACGHTSSSQHTLVEVWFTFHQMHPLSMYSSYFLIICRLGSRHPGSVLEPTVSSHSHPQPSATRAHFWSPQSFAISGILDKWSHTVYPSGLALFSHIVFFEAHSLSYNSYAFKGHSWPFLEGCTLCWWEKTS